LFWAAVDNLAFPTLLFQRTFTIINFISISVTKEDLHNYKFHFYFCDKMDVARITG